MSATPTEEGFSPFEESVENYFDLDEILATQQKMQISFNVDIPGFGFLENNPGGPLHSEEKVLMPYWIIEALPYVPVEDDFELISLSEPKCFKNRFKNQLIANPNTVNLYQACPYYYQFGCNYISLTENSNNKYLSTILILTYRKRIARIMDYSEQANISKDKAEFVRGLDEHERQLYKCGCESVISMKKWINREYGVLKIARSLNKSRLIL